MCMNMHEYGPRRCATGLSSEHVRRAFPGTHVTGVDLSPHMVAVGQYLQEQRLVRQSRKWLLWLTPSSILFDIQCPCRRCQKVEWSWLCVQLQGELNGAQPLEFLHANAEDTGLPAASTDLVTLSLVAHELPTAATAAIFRC